MSYFEQRMAEISAKRRPDVAATAADARPWKRWNSRGPQPVPDDAMVEVTLRNGHYMYGTAGSLSRKYQGKEIAWRHVGDAHDIVSWRLFAPIVEERIPEGLEKP